MPIIERIVERSTYFCFWDAFGFGSETAVDSNFRCVVAIEEGSIYLTSCDNSTPDSQLDYNPVPVRRFIVSSRFPAVEPRTVLREGIRSSNWWQWIEQVVC